MIQAFEPARVLVVDDERSLADLTAWILRDGGFNAQAVYDGASALQEMDRFHADIVLSDVIMPGMNGIETCTRIKLKYPACKILLFSGQAATSDLITQARGQGISFELLAKPIEPEELLSRVNGLAEERDA